MHGAGRGGRGGGVGERWLGKACGIANSVELDVGREGTCEYETDVCVTQAPRGAAIPAVLLLSGCCCDCHDNSFIVCLRCVSGTIHVHACACMYGWRGVDL